MPDKKFPRIGTAAIIMHDGKILLTHRTGSHGAGTWAPPGGHLEWGETPEQCAVRETLEETGVTVEPLARLGYTDDFSNEWNTHYITLFVLCRYLSGEPRVCEPDKCQKIEWVSLDVVRGRQLFRPFDHFLSLGILRKQHAGG